jgi:RNA polymerase sigma factor (sigma-70 family)
LLAGALRGEPWPWRRLVESYAGLVWSVARSFGLDSQAAADVSQTTWLKLIQYGSTIRDGDKVGSWLATTAANEARRILRSRKREAPAAEIDSGALDPAARPEQAVLDAELALELRAAVAALSTDCRQLLQLLLVEPRLSYEEIGVILDKPVGSIGPTRGRCLERLREILGA